MACSWKEAVSVLQMLHNAWSFLSQLYRLCAPWWGRSVGVFLLTGSEHWQGAVTIEPLQSGLIQLRFACSWHHPIEWLKERLDDDAELEWTMVKDQAHDRAEQVFFCPMDCLSSRLMRTSVASVSPRCAWRVTPPVSHITVFLQHHRKHVIW